jgi:tetratricopeptide (TPR) repeat protein
VRRAIVYVAEKNADAAIADLTKAIELDKGLAPVAYPLRASGYMKKEKLQAALDDLNKAIDLDATNSNSVAARSGVYNRMKRYPEALEDAKKAIQLAPKNSAYRLNYAYLLSRVGDYEGAHRELDEVEQTADKSAWYYNNLAWLLATADDDKIRNGAQAEEAMKEALQLLPKEPRLWDTQAAVCAELGRFDEAVKWEKRYLAEKKLTSEQRKNGLERLDLYQKRQAYRQPPGG